MLRAISLGVALYTLWLLLSGHFEPLLLILGVLSCLVVVAVAHRMEVIDHESHPIHITPKLPLYWFWLLRQIVKANLAVTKIILSPRLPISPTVVRVRAGQTSDLAKVIYANSITLTPGTVSINLDDDHIEVHALTTRMAADLQTSEMERRVSRLEKSR